MSSIPVISFRSRSLAWIFLAAAILVVGLRGASVATLPDGVRRVVFLGDSITYNGEYAACVEAYFVTRHPTRPIEFLNLGLSSETVSGLSEPGHGTKAVKFPRPDLHERLGRVLAQTRPDLVVACYGMNDGIYLPFEAGRFAAYQSGIRRLRAAVLAAGAAIIHLTPPVYDTHQPDDPGYDDVLRRYADWLLAQRTAGWRVVDIHGPMLTALQANRRQSPGFTFAKDRIHPSPAGHWLIAHALLTHLGAKDLADITDPAAMVAHHPSGGRILQLVRARANLLRDAWLTATGHQRPGVKAGLPLPEAQARAVEIGHELQALLASANPSLAPR